MWVKKQLVAHIRGSLDYSEEVLRPCYLRQWVALWRTRLKKKKERVASNWGSPEAKFLVRRGEVARET